PLAGARWEMADTDGQPQLVGQLLEFYLPQASPITVAAPGIRRDQQLLGSAIPRSAQVLPPTPDAGHGKLGGVVADADVDPPFVLSRVVDAVGTDFVPTLQAEVVDLDSSGLPLRFPLLARMSEIPDVFLLFRVHRDAGLPAPLELLPPPSDELKLGIPIRMVHPFLRLAIALQGVTEANQEAIDRALAHLMALLLEGVRQLVGTL